MKILRLSVLILALLCAVVAPSPARARAEVSFDFFYDSLAPYGDWIEVGGYGLCWTPTNVDPDWSPYSDGYWAFTDAGWTWVSYEDYGGIVYHYGRWIHLDNGQWCWTPDYEWAPAWVSWRYNDNYVGWAPLPPEAHWRHDVGFSVWVDDVYDMGPGRYSFCRVHDFGTPVLRGVIINREENLTIMRETVNVTNITYNSDYAEGPVIFNGGPSFEVVNRVSARPIPALKLVLDPGFDAARWREHRGPGGRVAFNAQTVGNQLVVAAPQVAPPADLSAFKSRVKTVIPAKKVNDGWSKVKNPEQYRQEFRRQTNGLTPETAPARPVAATDLQVVPAKGDPHATPTTSAERHEKPGKGQRPESIVTQPNNVPPNVPPATTPTTAERHDKPGKGQRPESIVTQPNNVPPNAPTAGNPLLKPFNGGPSTEAPKPKSQNAPTATFTPNPPGPGEAVVPGGKHPRSVDTAPPDRAAEQAKIRAEQDRITQQKQAEMANQQRQAEIAAQQQKQKQAETANQQRQAEIAAQQQKQKQTEMANQQRQAEIAAQQQKQKQISVQQEAAKMQAEESRRHEIEKQQQLQQQQQIQQQRAMDTRKAQDAERAHEKQIAEAQQHAAQVQHAAPQVQQHSNQPPPSQPQPANNAQHSKDSKDKKDKDKDKDKNGN